MIIKLKEAGKFPLGWGSQAGFLNLPAGTEIEASPVHEHDKPDIVAFFKAEISAPDGGGRKMMIEILPRQVEIVPFVRILESRPL